MGNQTIEWNLTFPIAVFNCAARSKDERGHLFLDGNPLKGLRKPREDSDSATTSDNTQLLHHLEETERLLKKPVDHLMDKEIALGK